MLAMLLPPTLSAGIAEVIGQRYERADLVRLSEYFTGEENTAGRFFVRAEPAIREGLYLIVQTEDELPFYPAGTTITVEVVTSANTLPLSLGYVVTPAAEETDRLYFGLSGLGPIKSSSTLLAWRVSLVDPEGTTIDSEESFLWRAP